jgi:stalled ribosome rescue protein Dom34
MTVPPRLSSESSMDLVSTLLLWSVTFDMDDSVFSSKRRRKKKEEKEEKKKKKKKKMSIWYCS